LGSDRLYTSVQAMLDAEAAREDGVDVIAIMTPDDSHYEYSMAALEHGFDVICDKPMTNTLEEAESLHKKVQETGLIFCLTHNYTGYPMVRQAKAMVQEGELGTIRLIQVEYVQGGKADESKPMPDVLTWKTAPLTQELTISGDVIAELFAATSGTDSDWVVKLLDIYPDDYPADPKLAGYQLIISDEVFRGRFRKSFEHPEAIPNNSVQEYRIDLHTANHVFLKGHRIGVQIQSAWFPLIDRNPQRFVPNIFEAKAEDFQAATQRIYRSRSHQTHIVLPVMPSQVKEK